MLATESETFTFVKIYFERLLFIPNSAYQHYNRSRPDRVLASLIWMESCKWLIAV